MLNECECELDFSKLQENPSLKVLEMDSIRLYQNVNVSGSNGIYNVDYEEVSLDKNTDFLMKYSNLEVLSLASNKLTQLSFASGLTQLKNINIADNYITDLQPLAGLAMLQTVVCNENPIEEYDVLGSNIRVIKE